MAHEVFQSRCTAGDYTIVKKAGKDDSKALEDMHVTLLSVTHGGGGGKAM